MTAELPADVSVPPPARLKAAVLAEIAGTDQIGPTTPAATADDAMPCPATAGRPSPRRRRRTWCPCAAGGCSPRPRRSLLVVVGVGAWVLVGSDPSDAGAGARRHRTTRCRDPAARRCARGCAHRLLAVVRRRRPRRRPDARPGRAERLPAVGDTRRVPASAGVFRPADDGSVLVLVEDFDPTATMAITEEPEGGSAQPTRRILVVST